MLRSERNGRADRRKGIADSGTQVALPRPVPSATKAAAILGPAFVASIAFVDPGNITTAFQAGALSGYRLMWVVLLSSVVAMVVQWLAARLGVVTGMSLPAHCRAGWEWPARIGLWIQGELVAIATDLGELVGAAIGLRLLFGVSIGYAAVAAALLSSALLYLRRNGHRPFELAVGSCLFALLAGFLYECLRLGPSASALLEGSVPSLRGSGTALLAAGILGATVMPHVVYLHSSLTAERLHSRVPGARARILRLQRWDVGVGLGLAALVNLLMLAIAARLFAGSGVTGTSGDILVAAHSRFAQVLGGGSALIFASTLCVSGGLATGVGTLAGDVAMQGFIGRRIPTWLRRLVTVVPGTVMLLAGADPARILLLSQVALSFGIPFALVPLIWFTSSRRIMGDERNRPLIAAIAGAAAAVIVALDVLVVIAS